MTSGSLNKKIFPYKVIGKKSEERRGISFNIYIVKSTPTNFSYTLFLSIKQEVPVATF